MKTQKTNEIKYIMIQSPDQIELPKLKKSIEDYILSKEYKTFNIHLILNFVAPDSVCKKIFDRFQVIKNKAAFKRDNKKSN
jgi:hypothetical protein